jgi:hypothetical protein
MTKIALLMSFVISSAHVSEKNSKLINMLHRYPEIYNEILIQSSRKVKENTKPTCQGLQSLLGHLEKGLLAWSVEI